VSYRSDRPDEETRREVQEELQKKNIKELVDRRASNCGQTELSTAGESTTETME
jgi:hypothetical protein